MVDHPQRQRNRARIFDDLRQGMASAVRQADAREARLLELYRADDGPALIRYVLDSMDCFAGAREVWERLRRQGVA